jgi:hypothetical protein
MGEFLDIAKKLREQGAFDLPPGTDKTDKTPKAVEPVHGPDDLVAPQTFPMELLDEARAEAFLELVDFMINHPNPELRLTQEEAEKKAGGIVAKSMAKDDPQRTFNEFKAKGYIKLYSTTLATYLYIVRDEPTAARLPDQSVSFITLKDFQEVRDDSLTKEQQLMILYGRLMFGGPVKTEDCDTEEFERRRKEKIDKKIKRKN